MLDLFLRGLKEGFYIVFSIIFTLLLVVLAIFPAWLAITYSWWWLLLYIVIVPFIFGAGYMVFSA